MKLTKFTATKVHGFLPYNILFKPDLTFLTGINGSGKTTALNLVVALITPNLATLQNIDFETTTITFLDNENASVSITAVKHDDQVTINSSKGTENFTYNGYLGDPMVSGARRNDLESEFYREVLSNSATNETLRFIASFPTPMFLGLDRRARLADEDRSRFYAPRPRGLSDRNVFGGSSTASLRDATDLAESAYRDARLSSFKVVEELQRETLLSLLTFSPETFGTFSVPTKQEIRDLQRVAADLNELPRILNIPKAEIDKRVAPFVIELQQIVERLPPDLDIQKVLRETRGENHPVLDDVVKWGSNRSQLKRIKVISNTVALYNERRKKALDPIEKYKGLVNKFLNDSGKSIDLDDHGNIFIRIDGVSEQKPMSSLSSGEAQIFVILTQLSFNKSAHRANVFIIDEPELSLHVYWQELFVDSVLSANDQIQSVMATHSPSIILDRLSHCVDISKRKKAGVKRG